MKLLLENWRKYLREARYESEFTDALTKNLVSDIQATVKEWPGTYKLVYPLTEGGEKRFNTMAGWKRERYIVLPRPDFTGASPHQVSEIATVAEYVLIEIGPAEKDDTKIGVGGQMFKDHALVYMKIPSRINTLEKFYNAIQASSDWLIRVKSTLDHEIRHGLQNKAAERDENWGVTPNREDIKKLIINVIGEEEYNTRFKNPQFSPVGPRQWLFFTWRPDEIEAYIVSAVRRARGKQNPQRIRQEIETILVSIFENGWNLWEEVGYSKKEAQAILSAQADYFYNIYKKYGGLFE
jgi:hypothetical protein